MAVKNYQDKIKMLRELLGKCADIAENINTEYLELKCTPSEESDFSIYVDSPLCDLISNIEQFIENIENDAYDDELDVNEDEDEEWCYQW